MVKSLFFLAKVNTNHFSCKQNQIETFFCFFFYYFMKLHLINPLDKNK